MPFPSKYLARLTLHLCQPAFGKDPHGFMTYTMKNQPLLICSKLILLTLFDSPSSCVGSDGGRLLPVHPPQDTQDVLTLHNIPNFLF